MKTRIPILPLLFGLGLAGWPAWGAAGGRGPDGLAQTEVGQQQLRASTARIADQLDAIIEEFRRNGLSGEDLQLLGTIRGVLGQLTEADMARVVTLLQASREGTEGGTSRSQLIEAFTTQKTVGLKLRQILLEYQRQQELAGVAARLEELAARQQAALRETRSLAEAAAGRRREWLSENQRISLQLQVSEQHALKDEVAAVLQRLRAWAAEPDNEASARALEALNRPETGGLVRSLEGAAGDLEGGRLLSAAGRQRAVRGGMRDLARWLMPVGDELEALQAAVREVEGLIRRQTDARSATRQLPDRAPVIEPVVRQLGDLVDDTEVARRDIALLDTPASEQVAAAFGRMQEARGAIELGTGEMRQRRLAAGTQQELSLARLESARRLLQQRIDTLEKQRQALADPLSNLRQVREDVAELIEREREIQTAAAQAQEDAAALRGMAPRQGDLADRAGDTAQRAALDSTPAAERIGEAMTQMRRSQRSLGEGQNDPGAQQAAIDALASALAVLDEQLKEMEAAEAELAELEQLLARLIALIEAQRELNLETARLARDLPGRAPAVVGTDQNGVAVKTRELEIELPTTVAQAATYLRDAGVQMLLAGSELGSGRSREARPPQDEALANLLRAKRELEDRMAQLREMLGQGDDQAALDQLAQMVREAQGDLNEAMSAEALQAMAEGMEQAGRRLQPATSGRLGRVPRMIRGLLEKADRSLMEGSAAAEGGDQAGADAEASEAQAALAAAAAALDLAMAGMGQPGGPGEGQGGQGQQPGQGQGRGRGRTPGQQAGRGTGDAGNFFGAGGAEGPRGSAAGSGQFIGLPPRERAALLQSQGERYPQEFAPQIEQYLRNLSDQVQEAPR